MIKNYNLLIGELEEIYGKANSNGYGSAVFCEFLNKDDDLGKIAFKHFKNFIGAKWTAETEEAWLSGWKNVFVREAGKVYDILSQLDQIKDPAAKLVIPLLTETIDNPEQAKKVLAEVFDHPLIANLTVNLIGDGAAMSGIIITGAISDIKACSVVCLMD